MVNIQNLTFAYPHRPLLFDNLNLNLQAGNIYGLLGKNGAGKTTLLKILSGLLFPLKGNVEVLQSEPRHRSPSFLQELYLLPEEFYLPMLTVSQYCDSFALFYPHFDYTFFQQLLQEFELSSNDYLPDLSYGQKKKFLLAFGLATKSRLLLLDEPTNGLDIPSKSQFRRIIAAAVSDERTIVISTHQVRDMANLIDPIVILDNGKIIFNHNLSETGQKLAVQIKVDEPEVSVLYYEKTLGGYAVLDLNRDGVEGKIDIELLFNAIINKRAQIAALFGEEA